MGSLAKRVIVAAASLIGIGCSKAPPGRYTLEADPGASVRMEFVRDRISGQWVYREFEIRVATSRVLPEPLQSRNHGDALSLQLFEPGSTQTGGLRSIDPVVVDGHRVWSGADLSGRPDVEGRVAYGVTIKWYRDGAETRYEPMEIFPLPALGDSKPGEWSPWLSAATLRPGAFAWWEEVHGKAIDSLPRPEHPFEFRWRTMVTEVPGYVP